jgi:hypothetical protein
MTSTAMGTGDARTSPGSMWLLRKATHLENPVPEVPKVPRFDLDVRNVGDALALLRTVPTALIKLSFWDPQYTGMKASTAASGARSCPL